MLASSNLGNFEIYKLHQLFQANYLISVGDYKSALHSYIELNALFEKNKHLRNDLWEKVTFELEYFNHDIFGQQVLRIFDFTAWIVSKIRRIALNDVLKSKSV